MKTRSTLLAAGAAFSALATAKSCTPANAEDITYYFIEWGIITEEGLAGGGSGGGGGSSSGACAEMVAAQGGNVFEECIEPYIIDVDFKAKLRQKRDEPAAGKRKKTDIPLGLRPAGMNKRLAGEDASKRMTKAKRDGMYLNCDSDEACAAFPDLPEVPLCIDPDTALWHDVDGSTGSWITGDYELADGTTGNFYTGESRAGSGGGSGAGSNNSGDDDSAAVGFAAGGKVAVVLAVGVSAGFALL